MFINKLPAICIPNRVRNVVRLNRTRARVSSLGCMGNSLPDKIINILFIPHSQRTPEGAINCSSYLWTLCIVFVSSTENRFGNEIPTTTSPKIKGEIVL